MNSQPSVPSLRAAAIQHDGSVDVDALLAAFVEQQRQAGRHVLGLLMAPRGADADCCAAMTLIDIATGQQYLVSQALGVGSQACRADPQAFARASHVLREAAAQRPDLVICNRFGVLEAGNGGFRAELLALLEQDIPVLTVVSPTHQPAWEAFIGAPALLPPDPAAWARWLDGLAAG